MATLKHQPVLLKKVIQLLNPKPGDIYLDLTAGWGGHAQAITALTGSQAKTVLIDRDKKAIGYLKQKFKEADIKDSDYLSAVKELVKAKFRADLIFLDLGLSSPQLAEANRGFSFKINAPLDMRMDQTQKLKAADLVNELNETELANIVYQYGQEHRSRRIARAIVANRPVTSTVQLAQIISRTLKPTKKFRIHPATKTFQALRIAVNDELSQLERTLPYLPKLLNKGGRIAVISFHSLEDRFIKHFFKNELSLKPLTKKPVSGVINDVNNPRARSAKLRAALKQK